MLHSAVRIIGDVENPGTGKWERRAVGTGFYVRVESEAQKDAYYTYIVTANHVVDGQQAPGLVFPDPYVPGGLYPEQPTEGPEWRQPLDDVDLAILPYGRPESFFVNALDVGGHIRETLPANLLAMPFHYVGLLEPEDRVMARSGTLGAIYERGVKHRDHYEYDCHLADCRSYKGFSGSPCFLEIAVPELEERDPVIPREPDVGKIGRIRYIHLLCGIVTWHLEPPEGSDAATVASTFGVVAILPHDYIWRALMTGELADKRREADELPDEPIAVKANLSVGASHPSVPDESEYQNFENLTRKLVNVPKPNRE
jgi:hypothetical protein